MYASTITVAIAFAICIPIFNAICDKLYLDLLAIYVNFIDVNSYLMIVIEFTKYDEVVTVSCDQSGCICMIIWI